MNEILYLDQSAEDLRLSVVLGELDTAPFNVLVTGQMGLGLGETSLEASIIGASHILSFRNGDFSFSEIFACTDVEQSSKVAFYGPLAKTRGIVDLTFYGAAYLFNASLWEWRYGKERLYQMEEKVKEAKVPIALAFDFPLPEGFSGPTPKTLVTVEASSNGGTYVVNTIHSYATEGKIVYTESLITPREVL